MANENSTQSITISEMTSNIDTAMSTKIAPYQYSKSYEIRSNINNMLFNLNQETYSYILSMNEYIRNNIKDSSFLKKSLIEKIKGNMGD